MGGARRRCRTGARVTARGELATARAARGRRLVGVLAAVVMLLSSGCGDSGDTSPNEVMTAADAQARLLDSSAFGGAWVAAPSERFLRPSSIAQQLCEFEFDEAVSSRLAVIAMAQFEKDDSQDRVLEWVVSGEPGQLADDVRAVIRAWDQCAAQPPDGDRDLTKASLPALGDQRAAYTIRNRGGCDERIALVRVGSVAVVLWAQRWSPPRAPLTKEGWPACGPPSVDEVQFVRFLTAAVERLTR